MVCQIWGNSLKRAIAKWKRETFTQADKLVEFFSDIDSLKEALATTAKRGDVVLIKGKNTNPLWSLLD